MAAALFESLIVNHPFVDGKKRVAFFTTDVFLCLNGCNLHVDANQAHRFLIRLLETKHISSISCCRGYAHAWSS
jgi:death-on-curing protein